MLKMDKVGRNIYHNKKTGNYMVNVGKMKLYVFPTLQEAEEFSRAIQEEAFRFKKEEAISLMRKEEDEAISKLVGKAYPFNAMEAAKLPEDADDQLFLKCLEQLTERERSIIEKHFAHDMFCEDIANEYHLTRQRVHQIIAISLTRVGKWMKYANELEERKKHSELLEKDFEDLKKRREQLVQRFYETGIYDEDMEIEFGKVLSKHRAKSVGSLTTSIEDLDLTIRTHNCLVRAGYENLGDIVSKTADEVAKIRNLGKKSFKELETKLAEYGLTFKQPL